MANLSSVVNVELQTRRGNYRYIMERACILVREEMRNAIAYNAGNVLIFGFIDDAGQYWHVFCHDGKPFESQEEIERCMVIGTSGPEGLSGSGLKTSAFLMPYTNEDFCLCVQSKCLDGAYASVKIMTAARNGRLEFEGKVDDGLADVLRSRMGNLHDLYKVYYLVRAPLEQGSGQDRGGLTKPTYIRAAVDYTPAVFAKGINTLFYPPPIEGPQSTSLEGKGKDAPKPKSPKGRGKGEVEDAQKPRRLEDVVDINIPKGGWNRGDRQLCQVIDQYQFEMLYSEGEHEIKFDRVRLGGKQDYEITVSGSVRLVYYKGERKDPTSHFFGLKVQKEENIPLVGVASGELVRQYANSYTLSLQLADVGVVDDKRNCQRFVEDPVYIKTSKRRTNIGAEMGLLGLYVPPYKEDKPYVVMKIIIENVHSMTQRREGKVFDVPVDTQHLWNFFETSEWLLTLDPETCNRMSKDILLATMGQNTKKMKGIRAYHETLFPPMEADFIPLEDSSESDDSRQVCPILVAHEVKGGAPAKKFKPSSLRYYVLKRADGTVMTGILESRSPAVEIRVDKHHPDQYQIIIPELSRGSGDPLGDTSEYDSTCIPKKNIYVVSEGQRYRIQPPIEVPEISRKPTSRTGRDKPRDNAQEKDGRSHDPEQSFYDGEDDCAEDLVQYTGGGGGGKLTLNGNNPRFRNVFRGWDPRLRPQLHKKCKEFYEMWKQCAFSIYGGTVDVRFVSGRHDQLSESSQRVFDEKDAGQYLLNQLVLGIINSDPFKDVEKKILDIKSETGDEDPTGGADTTDYEDPTGGADTTDYEDLTGGADTTGYEDLTGYEYMTGHAVMNGHAATNGYAGMED